MGGGGRQTQGPPRESYTLATPLQATLTPEKVKDKQTHEKEDEPQRAAETAFAAH